MSRAWVGSPHPPLVAACSSSPGPTSCSCAHRPGLERSSGRLVPWPPSGGQGAGGVIAAQDHRVTVQPLPRPTADAIADFVERRARTRLPARDATEAGERAGDVLFVQRY